MQSKSELQRIFKNLLKIFKFEDWTISLEFVENDWKNTGNVKVDIEGKVAIVYLNIFNPKQENLEEVLIHELCHIKLWKLDQLCESSINAMCKSKESAEYKFAYDQFMLCLEQTTQELAKTYMELIAENKKISLNRCKNRMPFKEESYKVGSVIMEYLSSREIAKNK